MQFRSLRRASLTLLLGLLATAPLLAGTVVISVGPGLSFSPSNTTIELGDTVQWVWNGDGHNVVGPGFDSGTPVDAPFQFEVTFDQAFIDANTVPGHVYNYVCEPHEFFGMTASLTVNVPPPVGTEFVRGDCNTDGGLDISDAIAGLGGLFSGSSITCDDACDVNDDGGFDIADMIFLLSNLFGGGAEPSAPFPACGLDPTDDGLECDMFSPCP
ncbi:MAG: plastocyanin/azurin family copper-binding protein [Planctomycetota bacterium]